GRASWRGPWRGAARGASPATRARRRGPGNELTRHDPGRRCAGAGRSGEDARLVVGEDLARGARAPSGAAFHEALAVGRAVLAREVAPALAGALVARERGVLPHLPARVAAEQVRVAPRRAQRRAPVPERCDARPHLLELREVPGGVLRDGLVGVGRRE